MTNPHPHTSSLLIVDDVLTNVSVLFEVLGEAGFEVLVAQDGEEALQRTAYAHPDLILLDVMMPGMDGFEVCQRLKASPETRDIPVIFMTALADTVDKVKGFELGAADYITKPFQQEEVLARVRAHLTIRQQQQQLEQANAELARALLHLRTTQDELIQAEKMAALGQLIAGIAHEINTPLGAIQLSVEGISRFIKHNLPSLPHFFQQLPLGLCDAFYLLLNQAETSGELLTSKEKRSARRALCQQLEAAHIEQAEALADTLVDIGIHLLHPQALPLLSSHNAVPLLDMVYQLVRLRQGAQTIQMAVDRAGKVVFALKSYVRQEQSGTKVLSNIQDGLETVLTLYHNQLKHGVEVTRRYAELPTVPCYPDELNQIWTNLIHNALQAMQYQGHLEIETAWEGTQVRISIRDSGPGIPEAIQGKIFEPFFTTKASGEGSGLGLDIVKKIVEKHQGRIQMRSVLGEGATFSVYLPIQP